MAKHSVSKRALLLGQAGVGFSLRRDGCVVMRRAT
jgi:hypothetical protein